MSTFSELINSDQPVLVDFYAEWCGPCKVMTPVLVKVVSQLDNKAKIIKVDVDKNPAVAHKYNVQGIPTYIIFKKGQIRWRQSGVLPEQMIVQVLKSFI
jgi:thioredoxin 1